MPPMIDAKRTMLVLLRDHIGCDYIRMRSDDKCARDEVTCGSATSDQLGTLHRQSGRASLKQTLTFDYCHADIYSYDSGHVHLVVQHSDAKQNSQHASKRKAMSSLQQRSTKARFDLITNTDFQGWFCGFLLGQDTNSSDVVKLQLILSAIVQNEEVFADYQRYTEDSLTRLNNRTALQSIIDTNIKNGDIALCMIHCQDFQGVNRKFGQAKGDVVLNEIAQIIDSNTRDDDITCRFGGALFGVAMHLNDIKDCQTIIGKLHQALQSHTFLNNALRLGFNIGGATLSQSSLTPDDHSASSVIIARAEQALRAAQANETPSFSIWEQGKLLHDEQEFDHLGGIFTPDNVTNYRNMLLLWDISSIIADEHAFDSLVSNVIERLAYTFEFTFAGIISSQPDSNHNIIISTEDIDDIKNVSMQSLPFYTQLLDAKAKTLAGKKPKEHQINDMSCLLVPLGREAEACFFIIGDALKFDLTRDSVMLFAGFARQIGKALKRSLLEEQLNRKLEAENATLVKEINELKLGLKSSALVYKSDAMQVLLTQTQRAAQTDTTVLVTGESGTGKEKLIHALHNLSDRNQKPLVIVDCGSIPETLIESELFGHIKGAFTGANSDKKGKVLEANGGILVLDEIGELPLLMQPKLLRFVQEKHFTPVGSTKPLSVDVKIVAVTNRDLLLETENGRFRKDLYYRLNVITLHNPPLRERASDIELLAKHFVKKFTHQYDLNNRFLSDSTIEQMKEYRWPGNIRQLENRLMQACLLSQNEEITLAELNLDPSEKTIEKQVFSHHQAPDVESRLLVENSSSNAQHNDILHQDKVSIATDAIKSNAIDSYAHATGTMTAEQWASCLETAIVQFVAEIEDSLTHNSINIGATLESYLFKQLLSASKTNKQIAEQLNIPISTARRKANKHQTTRIPSTLPPAWSEITALLDLITSSQIHLKEPLALIKHVIVKAVLIMIKSNMTRAAGLIGVSEPTLYKFKKNITA